MAGSSGSLEKKLCLEEGGRRQEKEWGRQDTGGKIHEAGYRRQDTGGRRLFIGKICQLVSLLSKGKQFCLRVD